MSSIIKLREMTEKLTKSEKKLAEYILNNLVEIRGINTYELAEKSGISQATIIRFTKKLGYSGFPAFKLALSEDLGKRAVKGKNKIIHNEINIDDSYSDMAKKVLFENISAINDTFSILDERVIEEAVELLDNARRIIVVGSGYSGIVGKDLHYKLIEVGKIALYDSDIHVLMSNLAIMGKEDVVFIISHQGKTIDVHNFGKLAKKRGIKVISLTKYAENPISDLADVKLHTVAEEVPFRSTAISSRIAQLSIIDLLYIGLVRKNYDTVKEYLKESNALVKGLKLK